MHQLTTAFQVTVDKARLIPNRRLLELSDETDWLTMISQNNSTNDLVLSSYKDDFILSERGCFQNFGGGSDAIWNS